MKFRSDRPIFQQIAEQLEEQIICGHMPPAARVPADRSLAMEFEVNANTVLRNFFTLEQGGLILKNEVWLISSAPMPSAIFYCGATASLSIVNCHK